MEKICSSLFVLIFINLFLFLLLAIAFICLGIIHRKTSCYQTNSTAGNILEDRLKSLLTVKSIVTLILTEVFAYLSIFCSEDQQQFMTVYTVIIAFYFGTQVQKNQDTAKNVKENAPEVLDEQKPNT